MNTHEQVNGVTLWLEMTPLSPEPKSCVIQLLVDVRETKKKKNNVSRIVGASSYQLKQLEEQNARLKDALVR